MSTIFRARFFHGFVALPSFRLAVFVYLAAACVYTTFRYLLEIHHGGQVWTTGDWLINYRAGFVRRGLTGSITYGLSDLTGINPLYVAAATQILVFGLLVGAVLFMLSRVRMSIPVAILAMSPVFLLMPFFFLKLAMIKEMIGFLAFSLVALTAFTAFTASRWPLWLGVAVSAAAGFAHEINAFLAPDLLALVLLLSFTKVITKTEAILAAAMIGVAAALAILTSMLFSGQGMGDAICNVMMSYNGRAEFCSKDGPTFWLNRDMAYGMLFTRVANIDSGVWPWFVLGFVLSMVPFFLFRVTGDIDGRLTRRVLLAAILGIIAFSPLFVIASDWGRWIAMHVFCLTILTYVALHLGLIEERVKNLNPAFLALSLVWAMPDYGEPLTTGVLQKAASLLAHVERFLG